VTTAKRWTVGALSDAAWAVRWLLQQASANELEEASAERYTRAQHWLDQVTSLLEQSAADEEQQAPNAPPFPLTKAQFHQLQVDIQRVAKARPAPLSRQRGRVRRGPVFWYIPPTVQESLEHLYGSIGQARITSWVIGGGLLVLALLNVVEFAVVTPGWSRYQLLIVNGVALVIVAVVWGVQHFHIIAGIEHHFHWHIVFHHADLHKERRP
jgi:hypothetical protein